MLTLVHPSRHKLTGPGAAFFTFGVLSGVTALWAARVGDGRYFAYCAVLDQLMVVLAAVMCGGESIRLRGPGTSRIRTPPERALYRAHAACMVALVGVASAPGAWFYATAVLHAAVLVEAARRLTD